uniref:Uncharacterized protein n=1 Tax=Anguilla anguilla TaxID=7936 RepID=A0A0E9XH79_ANGAN
MTSCHCNCKNSGSAKPTSICFQFRYHLDATMPLLNMRLSMCNYVLIHIGSALDIITHLLA